VKLCSVANELFLVVPDSAARGDSHRLWFRGAGWTARKITSPEV